MEDMITIKWHIRDVQDHFENERGIELSDEDARDLLHEVGHRHDASIGINWDVIETVYDMNLASDECPVDSDGCLINNDGDAETDME